ncbi:hypothetical protein ACFF2X_40070 [Cryptosporangium minutisporangium]
MTLLDTAHTVVRRDGAGAVETLDADQREAARTWLPDRLQQPGTGLSDELTYSAERYTDEQGSTLILLQGNC